MEILAQVNPIWQPIIVSLVMILGATIAWLALSVSRLLIGQEPSREKNKVYGCGEEVKAEETKADSERFYSPIETFFKRFYTSIRPGHSGDLNTYLIWVVGGMVIIFILILMEVG